MIEPGAERMTEVTVLPGAVRLLARGGETLLAAVTRLGYRYRYGCRRGGCGVCKVRLVRGEVRYERPVADTVLTAAERAAGFVVSCRAVPVTDVTIELGEGDHLVALRWRVPSQRVQDQQDQQDEQVQQQG